VGARRRDVSRCMRRFPMYDPGIEIRVTRKAIRGWLSLGILVAGLLFPCSAVAQEDLATWVATMEGEAEELYRHARQALRNDEYAEAADLYHRVVEEHPDSEYAEDALYWEAFARYRLGEPEELHKAIRALEQQRERFPEAATRGDAADLEVRIHGELAKRGDAEAMAWITRQTEGFLPWEEYESRVPESRLRGPEPTTLRLRADREKERDIRIAALNALAQMDPDRALVAIRKLLDKRDEENIRLREEAVYLLSRMDTPEAGAILLGIAKNDPDPSVREHAVMWLSSIPGEEVIDTIEEIARTCDHPGVQRGAMFALMHHPSPRTAELLREFAADGKFSRQVRQEAVVALARKKSPETLSFLMDLFQALPGDLLKDEVVVTISRFNSDKSRQWLLKLIRNEKEPVRVRETALSMTAHDPRIATKDFVKMYDQLSHRALRRTVIWVLSRRGDPDAAEKLLQIAQDESDPELRFEAVSWLGRTDDPRAAELLEELIQQ
jgi:HEAT repeat protein